MGARVVLLPAQIASKSAAQLATEIRETFEALFPLVQLMTEPDPPAALEAYVDVDEADVERRKTYPIEAVVADSGMDRGTLESWVAAIERKGQAIVYGPPGTGKTHMARLLAKHLVSGGDGKVEIVQFHPAYAYEDFIQGIRPRIGNGQAMSFDLVSGRFLDFCRAARGRRGRSVLIIDEINRANLARVFGELMYLLEYREDAIPLAAGGVLEIPANVRIIGTMNTADRSIALVDHALRRRFAFLALRPDYGVLRLYHERLGDGFPVDRLIGVLEELNRAIDDPHYEVGITFFLSAHLDEQLEHIWRMEIEPYLEEHFFDQSGKVAAFRWERVKDRVLG